MDYLRGNAPASAPGLFVICRYLAGEGEGRSESELRDALQILRSDDAQSDTAAVLKASLNVGGAIGILSYAKKNSKWTVDSSLARDMLIEEDPWQWFRGELLYRMTQHALRESESKSEVPDLILAFTWFLQNDPLNPVGKKWGDGAEEAAKKLGFAALASEEQWRSFKRWALALGLARQSERGPASAFIPEPSSAVKAQLSYLPRSGPASNWMGGLQARLPILGSPNLLSKLPQGSRDWSWLPASLVLGLRKLEFSGVLSLESTDDARDVVAISFGSSTRQIGHISVGGNS